MTRFATAFWGSPLGVLIDPFLQSTAVDIRTRSKARGHRGYGWMDPSKSCWVFMAFEMGRISCKHLLRLGNTLSWLDVSDRAQSTAGKGIASWPLAGRMRTPCDVGLAIKYCDERYGHGHMKGQDDLHTIEYILQPEVLIACCLVGAMVIELSCTS
jgi:hypothetical protein